MNYAVERPGVKMDWGRGASDPAGAGPSFARGLRDAFTLGVPQARGACLFGPGRVHHPRDVRPLLHPLPAGHPRLIAAGREPDLVAGAGVVRSGETVEGWTAQVAPSGQTLLRA